MAAVGLGFEMPPLFCPVEPIPHPQVEELRHGFAAWMDQTGLAPDPETRQMLIDVDAALMCGYIVPTGKLEPMQWFVNWNYWFWAVDVHADEVRLDSWTSAYARMAGRLSRWIDIPIRPTHTDPFMNAAAHCIEGLRQYATPVQLRRFQEAQRAWFFGAIHQVAISEQGHLPDVEEYLIQRLLSSGVPAALSLVEIVHGLEVPAEAMASPWTQAALEMVSLIVSIDNDFISYPRERDTGHNRQNIINVLAYQHALPLEEAAHQAVALRDQITLRFLALAENIPPSGGQALRSYMDSLRSFIPGNIAWEIAAPRYNSHYPDSTVPIQTTDHTTARDQPLPYLSFAWWWQV